MSIYGIPRIFIIESLRFEDEEKRRAEGLLLRDLLHLSDSPVHYVYLRTKRELEEVLDQFEDSDFRYLHLSCHGNKRGIALTFDDLAFSELGELVGPYIEKRRVFISACEVANAKLAEALLKNTGCYSVLGPANAVEFDRAAMFWASFYHLTLRDGAKFMNRARIQEIAAPAQVLFGVRMRYFTASSDAPRGFREIDLDA